VVATIADRARLKPPSTLSDAERKIFVDLVSSVDAKHFNKSDLPLLCRYVEAAALAAQAAAELKKHGAVIGGRVNPWVTVQEKSMRTMIALSLRLRLSPQSRMRTAKPMGRMSVYEKMALEDGDAD
jgi:P27 family predicted phage terminase small subunit